MTNKKIRWLRAEKDKLIQSYLEETGADSVRAGDFLEYIRIKPNHPLWELFFGQPESYWANLGRENAIRNWLRGTRTISVNVQVSEHEVQSITVNIPAVISYRSGRDFGGGYQSTDKPAEQTDQLLEIAGQGADDLEKWYRKYGNTATIVGADLSSIANIIAKFRAYESPMSQAAE